ncbi:MAG TPA: DUF4375 domain-containing protein [Ktedonobacterales bacterium]|nr:DUF4375 domain-containing protein [Ktedonobacterales bacterium]
MRYESVHLRVGPDVLRGDDVYAFAAMAPVYWTANIYRGPGEYEASLAAFTPSQRRLFAIWWYRAEVNNGGHDQFYYNPTGIVWPDALAGFELLGLEEFAMTLRESARRLGGDPPLERAVDLDAAMLAFARSHPEDFAFDGVVRKAVL